MKPEGMGFLHLSVRPHARLVVLVAYQSRAPRSTSPRTRPHPQPDAPAPSVPESEPDSSAGETELSGVRMPMIIMEFCQ